MLILHYIDVNKKYGEKAWRQLHKNAVSNIEQVLEAASHKAAAARPLTTHHENYVRRIRHAGYCWRRWDELISDTLLLTPLHGRAKAWRPARIYIQQLCAYTGCSLEDLPEPMGVREGLWESVRDIRTDGVTGWWWHKRLIKLAIFCRLDWCKIHLLKPFAQAGGFKYICMIPGDLFPIQHLSSS